MAKLRLKDVRHWFRQSRLAIEWGKRCGLMFPWAEEVYRLTRYVLRCHRRRRRHTRGQVASLGLTAHVVEKRRSHHG
jgi:hypothetical protein